MHNRVVEIQGQRIAGLGGVFRGQIWMPPISRCILTLSTIANIARKKKFGVAVYHYVIARLFSLLISKPLKMNKADILICHEAPKPHPMGFRVINQLAEKLGVRHVFHGHHHDNVEYKTNFPYKITNVGFRSVTDAYTEIIY